MEAEIHENHQKVASDSVSGSDSVFSWFLDQKREARTLQNIGFPYRKHRLFMFSCFQFRSRFLSQKVMKMSSEIHQNPLKWPSEI